MGYNIFERVGGGGGSERYMYTCRKGGEEGCN